MWNYLTSRSFKILGLLSGGLLLQSTCILEEDFDPVSLFAEVAATLLTDSLFFALDSYLVSVS